jgi:hypothetical protein
VNRPNIRTHIHEGHPRREGFFEKGQLVLLVESQRQGCRNHRVRGVEANGGAAGFQPGGQECFQKKPGKSAQQPRSEKQAVEWFCQMNEVRHASGMEPNGESAIQEGAEFS